MDRDHIITLIEAELHNSYSAIISSHGTSKIPFDKNDPVYLKGRIMGIEDILNQIRVSTRARHKRTTRPHP